VVPSPGIRWANQLAGDAEEITPRVSWIDFVDVDLLHLPAKLVTEPRFEQPNQYRLTAPVLKQRLTLDVHLPPIPCDKVGFTQTS
jgi:hypothetical protein